MPQPLDPAVRRCWRARRAPPLAMPDPALSLAERARAFRARDAERSPPPAFDGTIEDRHMPVRCGSA